MIIERSVNEHGLISDESLINHDRFTPSRVGLRRRGSGSGSGSKNFSAETPQQQRRATRAHARRAPAARRRSAALPLLAAVNMKGRT